MLELIGKTADGRDVYRTESGDVRKQTPAERDRENARFADMVRLRRAPGIRTDSTHFAGRHNQFADKPYLGDFYAKELRAMGGSPVGKQYINQLARYPGDPEAWVSSRSEIKERCERRGWTCQGEVTVKPPLMAEPKPGVVLDPKIVDAEVAATVAKNPEIAPTPKEREALWHDTYQKRLPARVKDKRSLDQMLADEGVG